MERDIFFFGVPFGVVLLTEILRLTAGVAKTEAAAGIIFLAVISLTAIFSLEKDSEVSRHSGKKFREIVQITYCLLEMLLTKANSSKEVKMKKVQPRNQTSKNLM